VITVSTACSSGAGAIALSTAMLRSGRFRRILTGGVDSLCKLTYYGFKSLQLIDPVGSKPLDIDRRGMSVAEGAGFLLLEASSTVSDGIEILGYGLSCDAHHPTQPHPEGKGALSAMSAALDDAGLSSMSIDYINLHGTGTIDNDRSEALAIQSLYGNSHPHMSSIKGATGHSLAASGAIEAVIATMAIEGAFIPANTGCVSPDPVLAVSPALTVTKTPVSTVLSNSFGFGGNNAAIIIGRSHEGPNRDRPASISPFSILGFSVVTGAGHTGPTIEKLRTGHSCAGRLEANELGKNLTPRLIRRLKRLSQMALSLSTEAASNLEKDIPKAVFFGTAWGSLSETHDFLTGLFESEEKFASPTDFIGSVHNAPAGQIALALQAKGPNLTLSGGDFSFEQALLAADHLIRDETAVLVLGADEGHPQLAPLFDSSVAQADLLSDGGGALVLKRITNSAAPKVRLKYFKTDFETFLKPEDLVSELSRADEGIFPYDLILYGIPAAYRAIGEEQLNRFRTLSGFGGEMIDYRRLTGEFGSASAVAVAFAAALLFDKDTDSEPRAILILGFGPALTAIEVTCA
jgi:3-oxoacyl-(acyl-carrier-protein) synthase